MARLWHGGAELNSTTDSVEVTTHSGTISISSTTVRTGSYAWRANPSSSTGFYRQQIYASNQNKGGYLRAYIRIATLPGTTIQILRFSDTSNAHLASIRLHSDGTLTLHNAANTQVGSASSALSTGVWYMIELKCDSTNATGTIDARLDGSSFASGNNSSRGSWARILWGAITPNSTCDLFFDDVALNDDQGANQTSWPGSGKLIRLKPNAAGDSNQWKDTGGSAGTSNNYTLVDEVTPNDTTDYIQSTTLNDVDFYNAEASGIGASDTVNVVTVHARLTNDVADATIAAKLRVEKTGSGTVTEGSSIIPNTTTWQTDDGTATFKPTLVTYADPDGSAWTQSTLDSMQIGVKLTADTANNILLSALWAYVDYTPASGTAYTQTLSETLTLTDSAIRRGGKVLSDTITYTDTILKAVTKSAFSEVFSLADTLLKLPGKLFSETTAYTDTLTRNPGKTLTETVTHTDTVNRGVTKGAFAETLSLTDTVTKLWAKVSSETLSLTDFLTTVKIQFVTLAETLSLTDLIAKLTGKVTTETTALTDEVTRSGQKVLTEAATLTDSLTKSGAKTVAESFALTDEVQKRTGKPLSEAASFTDTLIRAGQKVLGETLSLTDTLATALTGHTFTQLLTETLTLADTLTKRAAKVFSESLSLAAWLAGWLPVGRALDAVYGAVSRAADSTYNLLTRSSDASYSQTSRSSDANYGGVSRASNDDWTRINRES